MELRFADCSLDCDRYAFVRAGQQVDVQPKVWAFLRLLAENAHRVLSKEEIIDTLWPDVLVAEGSLQRLASLAREALGRGDLLRTIRGVGYQLAAEVEFVGEVRARPESAAATPPPSESTQSPEFRYCRTVDGVNVAWTSIGEGPAVVRALGWFTNLEYEWAWPRARRFWEIFGEGHRLILYDGRGMGLSDPSEEFSPEIRLRDLEAVVDAAEADRFDLVGLSEGCGTAINYALRHSPRVHRLVLYGPPSFIFRDLEPEDFELGKVMLSLIEATWGSNSGRFGRMLAELFVGQSADAETLKLFDRMQRASTDKQTAIRYFRAMSRGTRPDARALRVPTMIVHRKEDAIAPFGAAKAGTALISGARLIPIAGDNHWPMADDPTAPVMLRAITEFLDGD
jgi:pimeloyl-ACP methyl ester carboxylesterase